MLAIGRSYPQSCAGATRRSSPPARVWLSRFSIQARTLMHLDAPQRWPAMAIRQHGAVAFAWIIAPGVFRDVSVFVASLVLHYALSFSSLAFEPIEGSAVIHKGG